MSMRRRVAFGAATLIAILFAAAPSPASDEPLVVTRPVTNLYSKPTIEADVVSQATLGSTVQQLEKKGKWRRIRTVDDYQGWAPAVLRKLERAEKPYATGPDALQVTALQANVYREPDVTVHEPMVVLPYRARLEKAAEPTGGRWVPVRLPDRRRGWIQLGDVEHELPPRSIDDAIAIGRRLLGVTYLWGGTSSFGLDCSGFTQLLLRAQGTVMPRDADDQARWSGVVSVEAAELQPGDLLFFGSSMERITHTGMYIGGGEFIHATPRGRPGVQISRLDEPQWTEIHVCSRRVR